MARIVTLMGGRPWGFTMSGGKDFGAPLKISKMTPGGKAAKGGIKFNDYILEINGDTTEGLLHVDAQSMIKATGATLQLQLSHEAPKSPQVQTKFPHEYLEQQGSPDHGRPPRPPPPPADSYPAPTTYTSASYKTTAAVPRKPTTPEPPSQPSQIKPDSGLDSGASSTQQSPAFKHIKMDDRPPIFSQKPPSPPTQRMQNVVIDDGNVRKTSERPPPPSSAPIKVTTTVMKVTKGKPITKPAPPPTIVKPPPPPSAGPESSTDGGSPQKLVDRQGMCEACNQPIRGPFASAMGKVWHPEHFQCSSCNKALQNTTFVYEEDKIYCEECYQNQFAQTCYSCHQLILGPCISAVGLHWHQEHFSCSRCNSDLSKGEGFNMENNLLFCSDCYGSLYGATCYGCSKKIGGDELWVEALDHQWHPACFTCESCKKPLEGTSFFAKLGRPFCKSCA